MGSPTVVAPGVRLDPGARDRLGGLGLLLTGDGNGGPTGLAGAVAQATAAGLLAAVACRDSGSRVWRRDGLARFAAATRSAAAGAPTSPVRVVVLPAIAQPLSGPIAVLSPAGAASSYELYIAAGDHRTRPGYADIR